MSRLPRGYLQLEYIQSSGTQHVDTRFLPNQNTRVVIDFKSTFSTANSPKGLLGCRNSSDIGLFAFLYSNRIDPNYNGVGKSVTVDSLQRHVYDFNQNSFSVDGAAVSFDAGVFSPGYNLLLLSVQNYGAIDNRKAEGYLYACQIYDNGTLIRNYIPCVSPSGAVGLFDLVGREFYGDAAGGTFTAGPVVLPALPRGYKRLQYIQSSGTQHIDTDFKPNQNTTIAAEFVVLDASNDGAYLYGGGTGTARLEAYPWDGKLEFNYGSAIPFVGTVYANKRFYICQDKTKYTLSYFDGSGEWTGNHAEQSFTSAYTLAIFALNRGTVAYPTAGMQLYSCQIYDNGVPVRCFVPCINPSGEVGLYDAIFRKFYGNAGTGSFTGEEFPEAALPDGYQRVEYIQSSGAQYIDTRFKATAEDMRVVCDVAYTKSPSGTCLYGAQTASTTFPITVGADGNNPTFFVGSSMKLLTQTMSVNARYVLDAHAKNGTLTVGLNGVTKTASYTGTLDKTLNLALFGNNNNGTIATCVSARMYSCQIYDGDVLARDYIPCVELAAGKAGLYDLVNGTFSASAGSGAFISGPVVNTGIYEEPEITFLEYIESTGTQYVDTRFAPNQDTRIVCDYQIMDVSAEGWIFGYQKSWAVAMFDYRPYANGTAHSGYGTKYNNLSGIPVGVRTVVDKNKNVTTDGDSSVSLAAQTFQAEDTAVLFARRIGNQVDYFAAARVFLTQVYDDDTPIRDYLPARTSDGDVGLYDQVDSLFYPNAGTGVFLAGPDVYQVPAAPTGFTASVEGDKVTLRWDAKDEVLGYRVYRDGALLADTTATEIEDTVVPFAKTGYAVTAYNDLGEGKAAELTVYFVPENPMLYLVTDRTAADVAAGNAKGIYTATDLNRVGYAMLYIADIVTKQGIDAPVTPKTDWTDSDWVDAGDAEAYLRDLATLRNAVALMSTTPNPPADLEQFGFQQANDIEQILVDIHVMLSLVLNNLLYAGEIFAGEA